MSEKRIDCPELEIDIFTKYNLDFPDESKRVQASPSELNKRIDTCWPQTSPDESKRVQASLQNTHKVTGDDERKIYRLSRARVRYCY